MKKSFVYLIAFGAGIIALAATAHFYGIKTENLFPLVLERADDIRNFALDHYGLAAFFYIFGMALSTFVFIPITALATLIGGYMFGWFFGALYAVSGVTIGSSLLFLLIRYGLRESVQMRYAESLSSLNKELARSGAAYLLILQLLPLTPTWVLNLLCGLTSISLMTFVWTTWIGILPGSLIYTYAGQRIHEVHAISEVMTWDFIAILLSLAFLVAFPMMIARSRLFAWFNNRS